MNKEILFRGKRVDNDEWTFGDLIVSKNKYYIHPQGNSFQVDGVLSRLIVLHEVKSETVGQYTGLTDKNGKKIFEGDILRGFAYPFRDGEGKHNYYAEVVWFEDSPAFGLVTHKNPKSNVVGISEGNCEYMEDWETFLWEVIGNIYDNPELLEK